jgi:hypothetical protein
MAVLDKHTVKDDPAMSTDWTAIGARILEAATMASAIHLDALAHAADARGTRSGYGEAASGASGWWDREISDGNG